MLTRPSEQGNYTLKQLSNIEPINRWSQPPSFILIAMLSFLDGRSVAVHSRISSSWRSQLQSCTSSNHYAMDVDHQSVDQSLNHSFDMDFDYGDESCYDMFSTPSDAVLHEAFQTNQPNIHSLRSLKLSTTRLTKPACGLLEQLIFLETIELRLFESVATEWHRECLLGRAWNIDNNHPINHFNQSTFAKDLFVDERAKPALSYDDLHHAAIQAFGQSLMQAVHKLCHLKSLTIVCYLEDDENASSLYPALREQTRSIIEAVSNHPALEEIVFIEPRLVHATQPFHPKWLDTIPNLRSVQVIDPLPVHSSSNQAFDKKAD